MKSKWGMASVAFALSVNAYAAKPDDVLLKEIPCADQVFRALGQWETPDYWTRGKSSRPGEQVVKARTDKKGVTLSLSISADREVTLARDTKTETAEVRIHPSTCKAETGVYAKNVKLPKDSFTDRDLEKFLAQGRKNNRLQFIYIWSPHMNLSILGLQEAEKVAKDMKAELLVLLDPKADLEAAKRKAKSHGIKYKTALHRAESTQLFARDQRLHYPVYFVAHGGTVLDNPRWGQDFAGEMKNWVNRSLAGKGKPTVESPANAQPKEKGARP